MQPKLAFSSASKASRACHARGLEALFAQQLAQGFSFQRAVFHHQDAPRAQGRWVSARTARASSAWLAGFIK